ETSEPAEAEPMPARQRCDLFHLRQGDIPTESEVLVPPLQREQDGFRDACFGRPGREAEVEPEVYLARNLDHTAIDHQHIVAPLVPATRTRRPTDRARIWLHSAPIDPVAPITAAVTLAGSIPMRCAARSAPSTAVAAV